MKPDDWNNSQSEIVHIIRTQHIENSQKTLKISSVSCNFHAIGNGAKHHINSISATYHVSILLNRTRHSLFVEKILPTSSCILLHRYIVIFYIIHLPLRQSNTNCFNMISDMIVFTERILRRSAPSASTRRAASGVPCGSTCHHCLGPTFQTIAKKKNRRMFTTLWLFSHAEVIGKFVPIHHLKRFCSFHTAVWSNNR